MFTERDLLRIRLLNRRRKIDNGGDDFGERLHAGMEMTVAAYTDVVPSDMDDNWLSRRFHTERNRADYLVENGV